MFPTNDFESIQAELISHTIIPKARLRRYRSKSGKEPYYQFSLQSQVKPYREFSRIDAVLDSYQGEFEVFSLPNPMISHKTQTGLYLFQDANKGDDTVILGGANTNEVDAVVAGDFLQINGSKKAYRILSDADATAAGRVTVKLTQPLIQNYISPSTVKYGEAVEFQVSMTDRDSDATTADKARWGSHFVELIEQI
jgi:hypothetical protein